MLFAGTVPVFAATALFGPNAPAPQELLGMEEKALPLQYPALRKLKKPVVGPGGAQARWLLSGVALGNQAYDALVFMSAFKVSRIEYISTATPADCRNGLPFEQAKAFLAQGFGEERSTGSIETQGLVSQSVAFTDTTTDAALYRNENAGACTTRIVFKTHTEKDADAL